LSKELKVSCTKNLSKVIKISQENHSEVGINIFLRLILSRSFDIPRVQLNEILLKQLSLFARLCFPIRSFDRSDMVASPVLLSFMYECSLSLVARGGPVDRLYSVMAIWSKEYFCLTNYYHKLTHFINYYQRWLLQQEKLFLTLSSEDSITFLLWWFFIC